MDNKIRLSEAEEIRLVKYLKEELGYTQCRISQAVNAVNRMDHSLKTELMKAIATGTIPVIVIEKLTVQDLMERLNMNMVTAFLAIDYLLREPEEAKYILARKKESNQR